MWDVCDGAKILSKPCKVLRGRLLVGSVVRMYAMNILLTLMLAMKFIKF